jgi:hypothetical protein
VGVEYSGENQQADPTAPNKVKNGFLEGFEECGSESKEAIFSIWRK